MGSGVAHGAPSEAHAPLAEHTRRAYARSQHDPSSALNSKPLTDTVARHLLSTLATLTHIPLITGVTYSAPSHEKRGA